MSNATEVEKESTTPSYHELHITTRDLERTSIFNLPYGLEVSCNRVGGWSLWDRDQKIAGEYDSNGLRLDVNGVVICDSLSA